MTNEPKVHFETARLRVRCAVEYDIDDLFELYTDENVLKYNCIKTPTRESIAKAIADGRHEYIIELKESGKVIGTVGFSSGDMRYGVEEKCISYELNTAYTGRGYMTEALTAFVRHIFTDLGADVVSARVFEANERSLKMMARLGFRQEGTLRYAVRAADGTVHDDCLFALTRTEFEERQG